MLRRGQSAKPPSLEGISLVAYLSASPDDSGNNNVDDGCWLLLGSADNALAVVSADDDDDDDDESHEHQQQRRYWKFQNGNGSSCNSDDNHDSCINISHIISVADNSKSKAIVKKLQRRQQQHQQPKNENNSSASVQVFCHIMKDRLRPDEIIDLKSYCSKPRRDIEQAVGFTVKDYTKVRSLTSPPPPPTTTTTTTTITTTTPLEVIIDEGDGHVGGPDTTTERQQANSVSIPQSPTITERQRQQQQQCVATRGILVNCNQGHNRSPTLILSYLLSIKGMNLRMAWKIVLRARPTVDPLPAYRHALWQQELNDKTTQTIISGRNNNNNNNNNDDDGVSTPTTSSVKQDEIFHLHISEIKQKIRKRNEAISMSTKELSIAALQLRRESIRALLAEE